MPAFYDVAARQRLPSELRAMQIANRQNTAAARITEQSANYYDATGQSEASQKTDELGIAAGNMQARWGELSRQISDDQRQAADKFFDQIAAVQRYIELNPDDMEGAKRLYDNARDANQIPARGHALSQFNPRAVRAIATMKATTDPDIPWNWINTETNQRGSVDASDPSAWKKLVGPNVLFGRGDLGTGLEGGIPKNEQTMLRNAEANTESFLRTGLDYVNLLNASPDAATFVAQGAGFLNNMEQELGALYRQIANNTDPKDPVKSLEEYDSSPFLLGVSNTRIKAISISLAFQAAKAVAEAAGRDVSNNDVERFLQIIGAGSRDTNSMKQAFLDTARQVDRTFRINWGIRNKNPDGTRKQFAGDLGLADIERAVAPRSRTTTSSSGVKITVTESEE
jgi:hypothetical protein